MKKYLCALLLVHMTSGAFAQRNASAGYRVFGRVHPDEDQTPSVPVEGVSGAPQAARGNTARLAGATELGESVERQAFIAGDGTFEFRDVEAGFYQVELQPPMAIAPAEFIVRDRDVGVNVGRPWSRVAGSIAVEGGGPVPAFALEFASGAAAVDGGRIERRFMVSAGESFSFDLPAGPYRVAARALLSGFQLANSTEIFEVPEWSPAEFTRVLRISGIPPWVAVGGRVEGSVVASPTQKVTLTGNAAATPIVTAVNPDGAFEFPKVLPGRYEVRLVPAVSGAATQALTVGASGVRGLRIVVPAPKDAVGEFVRIEPGVFSMGCSPSAPQCREFEKPAHRVGITRGFEIGKYEVTQAQWDSVMGTNPSLFRSAAGPVDNVAWHDAQEFLAKLNTLGDGYRYRLPTEAEWEYAARAADAGPEPGGVEAEAFGWFNSNAGGVTHPVGQKRPNAWGLYDTRGNVSEWVADWYDESYYANSPALDPTGPRAGQQRTVRGGQFSFNPDAARATLRIAVVANSGAGLRLVREPVR